MIFLYVKLNLNEMKIKTKTFPIQYQLFNTNKKRQTLNSSRVYPV